MHKESKQKKSTENDMTFPARFKESVGLLTSNNKESSIIIWESRTPGLPLVSNPDTSKFNIIKSYKKKTTTCTSSNMIMDKMIYEQLSNLYEKLGMRQNNKHRVSVGQYG